MKRGLALLAIGGAFVVTGAATGQGVWLIPAVAASVTANWCLWRYDFRARGDR